MSKAFLIPVFTVLLAVLTSCVDENKTDDPSVAEVNLYSSRHYDTDQALYLSLIHISEPTRPS